MGDMADLALEHAELDCYPDFPDYGGDVERYDRTEYWRTQFGEWILISKMTIQHLENTCKMLERNLNQAHPSYFPLLEELEKRTKQNDSKTNKT